MPLPPKPFHSIAEIASRWQVDPLVIIGWAIEGRLALSAALPQVETTDGQRIGGLLGVAGEDVFALFYGESIAHVRRFRWDAKSEWQRIAAPPDGVPVRGASIVLARAEVERFERAHRVFAGARPEEQPHPPAAAPRNIGGAPPPTAAPHNIGGAPPRYDWDAFAGAVARRVHDHGVPESQGDLVREMSDWFLASYGAVPDESTLRRRIRVVWRELTRPG